MEYVLTLSAEQYGHTCQAEPTRDDRGTGRQRVTRQRCVRTRGARQWWEPPDWSDQASNKARNNAAETPATPEGEARAVLGTSLVGTDGP